ncbi:MAG: periplasmic heavy metal sensor [Asticcacaulis sp.]|nr:periplasmic heavy metal sensor [Asticcacaulis sp.]
MGKGRWLLWGSVILNLFLIAALAGGAYVKQSALSGEPDMNKARDLRAEAAKLAASDAYDAAKIAALSDEARGYEDQARAKVENALIQGMATLTPNERKVVANHLLRASFRFRYFLMKDGKGPDGKPVAPAVTAKP